MIRWTVFAIFFLLATPAFAVCPDNPADCTAHPTYNSILVGPATGGLQGTGSINAQSYYQNGVPFLGGSVTPTGAPGTRTLAAWANDSINPLFYGPGGAAVDQTGVLDTSVAFQNAINAACAVSPVKTVFVPSGTYSIATVVTLPTGCNELSIVSAGGPVVFRNAAGNSSNPTLFAVSNNDDLVFQDIIFDGFSPTNSNINGLVTVNWPGRGVQFIRCEFRNAASSGLLVIGSPPIVAGTNSVAGVYGDTSLTLSSVPSTVHAGAYFVSPIINPDIYVDHTDATHIYLSQPLTDAVFINTTIRVTPAFTLSAAAVGTATTLLTTDTSAISINMTLYTATSPCLQPGTRIVSIVANTSVLIDKPLQCKMSTSTNIAASGGISNLLVDHSYFHDLGQPQRLASAATYVTQAIAHSGDTSLMFGCVSGAGCLRVGLIPGDKTAVTGLPAGMPASNIVVDQTSVNSNAGTFTVTFANPLTADIAAGTPIPTIVGAVAGYGFGMWSGYGAWFANSNWKVSSDRFRDTWSSPTFLLNQQGLLLTDNVFTPNYNEVQGPLSAPSACGVVAMSIDSVISRNTCTGATGAGFETLHNARFKIVDNTFAQNGTLGIYVCNGHDIAINGNIAVNNGQYVRHALTNQYSAINIAGILLNGSCTFGQLGVMSNLIMSGNTLSDDQATPTQQYGIGLWNHSSIIANPVYNTMLYDGNVISPSDPALGIVPPIPGVDNRIINPCGALDQRNEGAVVSASGTYGPDQWKLIRIAGSTTLQRDSTAQTGCATSFKVAVSTTVTPTAAQLSYITQPMQSQVLSDLKFGTSLAVTTIVDFCVKASTAGTYGWGLYNHNAVSGDASYASSYTVADTASHCLSFTVAGDTAHALTNTLTNQGLSLQFDTGSGSNAYTGTCNAWQSVATSNQLQFCNTATTQLSTLAPGQTLEVSSVRFYPAASDSIWVPRSSSAELALAQVYYAKSFPSGTVPAQNAGVTGANCYQNPVAGGTPNFQWQFPVAMRVSPSIVTFNPSAANANWRDTTTSTDITATVNPDGSENNAQVLIGAGVIAGLNDTVCIHTTASAAM